MTGLVLIIILGIIGIVLIVYPKLESVRYTRLEIPGSMYWPGSIVTHGGKDYSVVRSYEDYILGKEV